MNFPLLLALVSATALICGFWVWDRRHAPHFSRELTPAEKDRIWDAFKDAQTLMQDAQKQLDALFGEAPVMWQSWSYTETAVTPPVPTQAERDSAAVESLLASLNQNHDPNQDGA